MHFVDPVQKLWMQIDQLHLALMDMEESAGKLDYKRKLEACMKDYLSAVPLERRFYFQVTNNVLYQTVLKKQDEFNPVRTALAWDTLNTYASNLLTQPWRREFRELRLYCGVFKHQVEGHLIGAVEVLNLLGYRNVSGMKLTLEGPVDPDRVARVARDCLLAKTECEILRYIWEGVSSKYTTSWEEIVAFRRDYISTPEQAMRSILYRRREEEYYKQYGPPIHCPSEQHIPLPYPDQTMRYPGVVPPYNPYPYTQPPVKENGFRPPPIQYPQQGYLQPAPPSRPVKSRPANYDQNMNENKYHLLDTNVDDVGIKSPLIPLTVLQMSSQEEVKTTDEQLSVLSLTERPKKGEQTPSTGSVQYSGGHTIWDYVYRDLESQGYSKDLGERGNVLERSNTLESRGEDNHASFDEIDNPKRLGLEPRERNPTPRNPIDKRFDYEIRREAALSRDKFPAQEPLAERRFENEQERRDQPVPHEDRKILPRHPYGQEPVPQYAAQSNGTVFPREEKGLPSRETGPSLPQQFVDKHYDVEKRAETWLPRDHRGLPFHEPSENQGPNFPQPFADRRYDTEQRGDRREAMLPLTVEKAHLPQYAYREDAHGMENGRHFDDRFDAVLPHQRVEDRKTFAQSPDGAVSLTNGACRENGRIVNGLKDEKAASEARKFKGELESLRKQKDEIERRLKEDLEHFQSSTQPKRAPPVKQNEKISPLVEHRPVESKHSDVKEFDPLIERLPERKLEANPSRPEPDLRRSEPDPHRYEPDPRRPEPDQRRSELDSRKSEPETRRPEPDPRRSEPDPRRCEALPPKPAKWECQFCTYINPANTFACEICSKSRDLVPEAVAPLESGGKECWKCTLVNSREERICVACGASLEGSPTYI